MRNDRVAWQISKIANDEKLNKPTQTESDKQSFLPRIENRTDKKKWSKRDSTE